MFDFKSLLCDLVVGEEQWLERCAEPSSNPFHDCMNGLQFEKKDKLNDSDSFLDFVLCEREDQASAKTICTEEKNQNEVDELKLTV